MAQVINSGSSVLVKADSKHKTRKGQAGRTVGGSAQTDHETVEVCFDLDQAVETVNTDDLTVLGT